MGEADAIGASQFHIIGHSMGGIVATLVAGALVTRVLTLTIIDAIGATGIRDDSEEAPQILEKALNQRSTMMNRKPRTYDTLEDCIKRWSESRTAPVGEENVKLLVMRGTERIVETNNMGTAGYRFRHDPRLRSLPAFRMNQTSAEAFLKRVACPTLLYLATDRTPFWPVELEDKHAKLLRAHVVKMEGSDASFFSFSMFHFVH